MKKSTRCILKNVAFFVFSVLLLAITACETTQTQTKKDQSEADVLFEQGKAAFEAGNYKKAFTLLSKSAEQNCAEAQTILGFMYLQGLGIKPDYQKAVDLFTKSAEQGLVLAQLHLGLIYEKGLGVKPNMQKAAEWYSKAAAQGSADAQKALKRIQ